MRQIHVETDIAAPCRRVWSVLTDFAAYPAWNPFITRLEGEAREGARLTVRIHPPGGRAMTFRPTVLAAVPGRELRWLGHLLVPGLFDGEHAFRLEPRGAEGCRLVQEERFRGLLVPLLGRALAQTRKGFEAMNQALKERAEG